MGVNQSQTFKLLKTKKTQKPQHAASYIHCCSYGGIRIQLKMVN